MRAHVKNSAGEQLSIFVSFVRTGDAFSVNFAVSDPANKTFSTDSICDNKSAAAMLDLLKSGAVEVDDVLKQALTEELEKGNGECMRKHGTKTTPCRSVVLLGPWQGRGKRG